MTYGPVFRKDEFLIPILKLQKDIEALTTENGLTLADVCSAPLSPQDNTCLIENVWAYWQDDIEKLEDTGINENGHNDTYLDHLNLCIK